MEVKSLLVEQMDSSQLLSKFEELKEAVATIQKHLTEVRPLELMTREEVSKLFKVSYTTLRDWGDAGLIIKHSIGGRVYFKREEIEQALVKVSPTKRNNKISKR